MFGLGYGMGNIDFSESLFIFLYFLGMILVYLALAFMLFSIGLFFISKFRKTSREKDFLDLQIKDHVAKKLMNTDKNEPVMKDYDD